MLDTLENTHQTSSSIESKWNAARFWENRNKIRVATSSEGYVHVHVATQDVWQRYLEKLASFLRLGRDRQFFYSKEDYALRMEFTPEQIEKIRSLLLQKHESFPKLQKEVAAKLYEVKQEGHHLSRQLALLKFSDKTSEQEPVAVQSPVQEEQVKKKMTLEEVNVALELVKKKVGVLPESKRHDEPKGILERLIDYCASAQTFAYQVPEEDNHDFAEVEKYKRHLREIEEILYKLDEEELSDEAYKAEISELKARVDMPLRRMKSLDEYFSKCLTLEDAENRLKDQITALNDGKVDFSLDACKAILHEYAQLKDVLKGSAELGDKWKIKLERKIEFQSSFVIHCIDTYLDALSESVRVEVTESAVHLDICRKRLKKMGDELSEEDVGAFWRHHACFLDIAARHEDLVKELQALCNENKILEDWKDKFEQSLERQKKIARKIKTVDNWAPPSGFFKPKKVNVKAVRAQRPPLSIAKKEAVAKMKERQTPSKEPPRPPFMLTAFFTYLQLWDLVSSHVGSMFVKPVGKRDYGYYLSKMQQAIEEGTVGEYDKALERARSFWGIDHDFLEHYDKYLRGDLKYVFQFVRMPSGQSAAGLFSKDPSDLTAWETFERYQIYPAIQVFAFDKIRERLDTISASQTLPVGASDAEAFNYYFYKMYDSVKRPGVGRDYQSFKEAALNVEGYTPIVVAWEEYLKSNYQTIRKSWSKSTPSWPYGSVEEANAIAGNLDVPKGISGTLVSPDSVELAIRGLQVSGDVSHWQHYVQNYIYTGVQEATFDKLIEAFDAVEPMLPAEDAPDEQLLYYYLSRMLKTLKDPSSKHHYGSIRDEANSRLLTYRPVIKEWDVYLSQQVDAFGRSLKEIPLTTKPLGKALLKSMLKDAVSFEKELAAEKEIAEDEGYERTLESEGQRVSHIITTCRKHLHEAPPEHAVKDTVEEWLKTVNTTRQEYLKAQSEVRATIAYQKYKEHIAISKLKTYLDSPSLHISNLTLAQAFGSNFLYGLPFDKVNVFEITEFKLQALYARINTLKSTSMCSDEQVTEFCSEYLENPVFAARVHHSDMLSYLEKFEGKVRIAKELSRKFAKDSIGEFTNSLRDSLTRLKQDDSIFFADNKHGSIYEIIKQPSWFWSYFSVRIYNADARTALQPITIKGKKEKIFSFRQIDDIEFSKLLEANVWTEDSSHSSEFHLSSGKSSYKRLVETTGGIPKHNIMDSENLITVAQNSYYQTFVALMSSELTRQHAPRFQFETQCKILYDLQRSIEKYDPKLLKGAIAAFTERVTRWHDKGVISDKEIVFAVDLAEKLFKEATQQYSTQRVKDTKDIYPFVNLPLPLIVSTFGLPETVPVVLSLKDPSKTVLQQNEMFPNLLSNVERWDKTAVRMPLHLKQLTSEARATLETFPSLGISALQEFIAKIPLDDPAFWKTYPRDQAMAVLGQFRELNKLYISLMTVRESKEPFFKAFTEKYSKEADYLAKNKILALSNILINECQLLDSPISFFSPEISLGLDNINFDFQTRDPLWAIELHKLKNYWQKMRSDSALKMVKSANELATLKKPWSFDNVPFLAIHRNEWALNWVTENRDRFLDLMRNEFMTNKEHYGDLDPFIMDYWLYHCFYDPWVLFLFVSAQEKYNFVKSVKDYDENSGTLFPTQKDVDQRVPYPVPNVTLPEAYLVAQEIFMTSIYTPQMSYQEIFDGIHSDILLDYGRSQSINLSKGRKYPFSFKNKLGKLDPRFSEPVVLDLEHVSLRKDFPHNLLGSISPYILKVHAASGGNMRGARRGRFLPNDIPLSSRKLALDKSWIKKESQARDILSLSSLRETQIQRTVSYFTKHLASIGVRQNRDLLKYLIFESDYLIKEFASKIEIDNRKFAADLNVLCANGAGLLEKNLDYRSLVAWLNFVFRVRESLKLISELYPEKLPADALGGFYDARVKFRELLAREDLSIELKALLHRDLAKTYIMNRTLTADEAVEMISCIIHENARPTPKEWIENRDEDWFMNYNFLKNKREPLELLLAGEKRHNILNGIYRHFFPGAISMQWKIDSTYPVYISVDGKIEIDVMKGTLKNAGEAISYLPETVLEHPDFISIFGVKREIPCKQLNIKRGQQNNQAFAFNDINGKEYRVIVSQESSVTIQANFKGSWHQFNKGAQVLSAMELPKALLHGYDCWYASKGEASSIVFTDASSGEPRFSLQEGMIRKIGADGENTSEVAIELDPTTSLGEVISVLEDTNWSVAFKNIDSDQLTSLAFPRLGLSFQMEDVDGQLRAVCVQYPDYYLAQRQAIDGLPHFKNYLVLENRVGNGQKMLVMPHPRNIAHEAKDHKVEVKTSCFIVDEVTQKLIPSNSTDSVHLAYLAMLEGDFEAAFTLIEPLVDKATPLNPETAHILHMLSELDPDQSGTHPQADAVKIKAVAMLLKNSMDNQQLNALNINGDRAERYLDAYAKSLQFKTHRSLQILTKDEERVLIRALSIFLDPITHPKHRLIISRMSDLKISLSQELVLMSSMGSHTGDIPSMTKLHFDEIRSKTLKDSLDGKFEAEYEFLWKIQSEDQVSWTKLRDYTYKLIGEDPGWLSWWKSREALISIIDKHHFEMMKGADITTQLKALLLSAVTHHSQHFPENLFEYRSLGIEGRDEWIEKHLIGPLRTLVVYEPSLQRFLASLKIPEIEVKSKEKPKSQRKDFDFSTLVRVPAPVYPINPSTIVREDTTVSSKAAGMDALQNALKVPLKNPMAQRLLRDLSIRLANYKANLAPDYEIVDIAALNATLPLLQDHSVDLGKKIASLKEEIERFVNTDFLTVPLKAIQTARMRAGHDRPITIEQVIYAYLRRNVDDIVMHNPALNKDRLKQVFQKVLEYLIFATQQQYVDLTIKKIDDTLIAVRRHASKDELQELVGGMAELLYRKRESDISQHPEYLVLEHAVGFRFRSDQVQILDKLAIVNGVITQPQHLGIVCEAIPGFGKTSVVMPILSMQNADGDNLAIAVMPKVLIKSQSVDLQNWIFKAFGQSVVPIEFTRNSRFDVSALTRVLDRFDYIRESKNVMLTASESLQALFLKMAETLSQYHDERLRNAEAEDLKRQIELFFEIIEKLKKTGNVVIDEIDSILDVLKSFHYTLGTISELLIEPSEASLDLYKYLLSKTKMRNLVLSRASGGGAFTKSHFNQNIKPTMVEAIMNGEVGGDLVKDFINGISAYDRRMIKSFLNNDLNANVMKFMNGLSTKLQDIFAVYKEQINELLTLTLSKQLMSHYGPSKYISDGKDYLLTIPYHMGRQSVNGTQFGTELEIINYTFQMYSESQFTVEVMKEVVELLQEKIKAAQIEGYDLSVIPDAIFFSEMFDGERKFDIFALTDDDMADLADIVNGDINKALNIVFRVIIPEMKIFQRQLNADAQVFGILFKKIQGFSGTVWNSDTYAKVITEVMKSNADAKTLSLIWNDDPVRVVSAVSTNDPEHIKEVIRKIIETQDNKPCSLIDAANIFAGIPNEQMARFLCEVAEEMGWDIQGCVYYDTEDRMMVLTKINGEWESVKKETSAIPTSKLLAYWDQSHSRGSDISLSPTMVAGVTVGRHTLLVDLVQAVLRLRDLAYSQKVHFALSEENKNIITEIVEAELGRKLDHELKLQDLLIYFVTAQAERQGQDNYRAFKQKMRAVALEKAIQAMIDVKDVDKAVEIYDIVRELFEDVQERRPFLMYAHPIKEGIKSTVVRADITQFLDGSMMRKFKNHPILQRYVDEVIDRIENLAKTEIAQLPDFIKQTMAYGRERSVETQRQRETNQQKHMTNIPSMASEDDSKRDVNRKKGTFAPIPYLPWTAPTGTIGLKYLKDNAQFLHSVNDVIRSSIGYEGQPPFDADLFCSENLCPLRYLSSLGSIMSSIKYNLFDDHQKNFYQVLVIKDVKTSRLKMVMIDQNEEKEWKNFLMENINAQKANPSEKPEVLLALYDLNTGIYVQGSVKDRIDPAQLENDQRFLELKVQAKFFNGEIAYSQQETFILQDWFNRVDYTVLREMFVDQVMPWKEIDHKKLRSSQLGFAFGALKKKKDEMFFGGFFKIF